MDEIRLGSRTLEPHRQLLVNGRRELLGKRALDVLSVLAEARGKIVTKDELLAAVWPGVIVEENALQVHIVALRKVLGPEADRLRTIRGVGYQLDVDGELAPAVEGVAAADAPTEHPAPPASALASPVRAKPSFKATAIWAKLRSHRWALALAALLLVIAASWTAFGDELGLRPQGRVPVVVRALTASGGSDRTEAVLASGITDELIVRLRRVPELRIATADADGSVPSDVFRNAYVVDGTIRSVGNQVRVTAQLLSPSGEVLWSQTFDRRLADLLDIQEAIAASIADALSVSFDVGADATEYGGTTNPEAYAAYLQSQVSGLGDQARTRVTLNAR